MALRLAALLCLLAAPAAADTALDSQADARRLLAQAVAATGGEAALRGLGSVRRDYLEDWVEVGQGRRPFADEGPLDRLPPHSGFDDSKSLSWLDYSGQRYYESVRYADAPNDYAVVVESGSPERGFQSIAYMDERPFYLERTAAERDAERLRRFRRYPEGLLRLALERPESLVALGRVAEEGALYDAIAFADAAGSQTRLYFDSTTHLLARAVTVRPHRVYGDTTSDTVYTDYRPVGRLQLPFSVVVRVGGIPAYRLAMRSMELDAPPRVEWFEPPADRVAVVPAPESPFVVTLGGGVHLIRGAYNLAFAEFRDYVLLVEAPMSEAYAEACLDLVSAAVPGKPIRLVTTHFHFDHVAGVRAAVARGIPVLTTPDARGVIERSAASRQSLRPDALARAPRAASIEVAGAKTVLDDGSQRVELYDFGPIPHVAQVLVAWFPRQRMLHVADMLDVLTPEQVIAGVDAAAMEERIRALGLDVETIVPMHGVPVGAAQLRRGLEIRRKYQETER